MTHPNLSGAIILVVADEPLIVLDISTAFEDTGAKLTTTSGLQPASLLVEHADLTAAILDNVLKDGDCAPLCTRLKERGIPFMVYSAVKPLDDPCKDAQFVMKPAPHAQLRDAMEALIRESKISN